MLIFIYRGSWVVANISEATTRLLITLAKLHLAITFYDARKLRLIFWPICYAIISSEMRDLKNIFLSFILDTMPIYFEAVSAYARYADNVCVAMPIIYYI